MKLHFLFLLCSVIGLQVLLAQKQYDTWVTGSSGDINVFKFDQAGYTLDSIVGLTEFNEFFRTNASISDSMGNLILFTGGTAINNANGEVIDNGIGINPGFISDSFNPTGRYSSTCGALFLESYESDYDYVLLHTRGDSVQLPTGMTGNVGVGLLKTDIAFNQDSMAYSVVAKNQIVISDTLIENGLAACRMANGRDWWIITVEMFSNCYYLFAYGPKGLVFHSKQCIGEQHDYSGFGEMKFSNDGTLLGRANSEKGIEIFKFDRCSGLLSNPSSIPVSRFEPSILNAFLGTFSFSPDSKLLYAVTFGRIYQYQVSDLSLLLGSELLIYNRDTAAIQNYVFSSSQLAPDGRLYIGRGTAPHWHRINSPNNIGPSCNLEVLIPIPFDGSNGFQNSANLKLGRLIGSECDTLFNDTVDVVHSLEIRSLLKLYPNPTNGRVRLEYGNFLWRSNDELQVAITNTLGQLIVEEQLAQYSLYKDYDVSEWNSGLYWVSLYNRVELVGIKKLMVD